MNTTFDFYTSDRCAAPRMARPLGELFAAVWMAGVSALRQAAALRQRRKLAATQAYDAAALRAYARTLDATDPSLARELTAVAARF